jgi:hypothetical protein
MWKIVETALRRLYRYLYKRGIGTALALHRRGEVRPDGLRSIRICNQLVIDWRARRIHPWDSERPAGVRRELFVQQSLADTEAAISRLFETLPQIDMITLRVIDPDSDAERFGCRNHRQDGLPDRYFGRRQFTIARDAA